MLKNIAAVVIVLIMAVELYLATAGSKHKMKRVPKGWNRLKGTITKIEKKDDGVNGKSVMEISIETEKGRQIFSRVDTLMFMYEEGEEVWLMEKDGYHTFLGSDRVDKRGRKELFFGLVPVLCLVVFSMILAIIF